MTDSSYEQIANLIARYAFATDDGDFAALGGLFADASFRLNDGPAVHGAAAVTARSRSYFTVFQSLPDLPLPPTATRHYEDRFTRAGDGWRFAERTVRTDFTGDTSHHVRPAAH
jgi:hypothetical protein